MKALTRNLVLSLLSLILIPVQLAHAQDDNVCNDEKHCSSRSTTVTASGTVIKLPNIPAGMTISVEELITGSPATSSIVMKGCKRGGTCDTLETNTDTTSGQIRTPTVNKLYDYFTVTPSWTGGTNVTVTVNSTLTTAKSGSGAAPGSDTDLIDNSAGAFGSFADGGANTVLHGGKTFSQVSALDVDSSIALASQISQPTAVPGTSQLLTGGGVAWTGGLNFLVSPATYSIAGTQYSSSQTSLALSAANASNDRIDVIAVDNTGTAVVITGTPAATPAAPNVDPSSQIQLTFAYIAANATTPSTLTETDLYLDNASEWTCAVTSNLACASTSNPYQGTKDIEATSAVAGNNVTLTKPSTTVQLSSYNNLVLYIRSKATWATAKSLAISWLNGTTVVGTSVGLKTGVFGFSSTNTSSYQQIVIPVTAFAAGTNNVSALKIQVAGGGAAIGFYIDDVFLQGGVAAAPVALPTMLFRGAWSSTATYNPNDVVTLSGLTYIALLANSNSSPSSSATNWQLTASPATRTKCAAAGSAASPSVAACSAAPSGSFSCATNASTATCTVNTTAVTASSAILVQPDSSLGSLLSVTCNTTADTGLVAPRVSARAAATSFTITLGTFSTNPLCFNYWVVN